MSKHEDIIKYILSLEVGTKVSVRSIANELGVSEGTAYRAIKDSDALGIVTTVPRVGTVRIEKVEKKNIEVLTYGEVINIIDGTIISGKGGMYKRIDRFVIGAMTLDAMEKYISPGCLLIVGNREKAQKLALLKGCGLIITGGFGCSDYIKKLASEKALPIISSTYDTFTIASMINKAISENLIKKDIVLIEDIMTTNPYYLKSIDKVGKWKKLIETTKHGRYPVVDNEMKVVGIVTLKEFSTELNNDEYIESLMVKDPITVTPKTTAAYAAHVMGWENGIELCPVIDGKKLIGVITRQDIIRALQHMARQPQMGETIEDLILKNFELKTENDEIRFRGKIIAEMLDPVGIASWGALNMLLSTMGIMILRQKNILNVFVDSVFTYFMKPVQIDSFIEVFVKIVDNDRNFYKIEINMTDDKGDIIAKTMMSTKVFRK